MSAGMDGLLVPVGFVNYLSHDIRVSKLHRENVWYEKRIPEMETMVMTKFRK